MTLNGKNNPEIPEIHNIVNKQILELLFEFGPLTAEQIHSRFESQGIDYDLNFLASQISKLAQTKKIELISDKGWKVA